MPLFRPIIVFTLTLLLVVGISQSPSLRADRQKILHLYQQAEKIFIEGEKIADRADYSEEKEIELNKLALVSFKKVSGLLVSEKISYDSLLFFTQFRIGVLEHYFGNYTAAGVAYSQAISLKKNLPSIADSLLFKPFLYLGIILYHENQFDSALAAYKTAETIASLYSKPLNETERLYNTLGVIYHETGNYKQARNYFEKAIQVLPQSTPYYRELLVNYKINLASTLAKTEDYPEALAIYEEILPSGINRDVVLHNTGVISLDLDSVQKALAYFRQVNYRDERQIRLLNDYALAWMNAGQTDSARQYLEMADARQRDTVMKTITRGQTFKLWGDLFSSENNFSRAASYYHLAIQNFYPAFSEKDFTRNPQQFSGIFSYINLFHALTAKAEVLEKATTNPDNLQNSLAALDAYRSAFNLAAYVERSYDSDEARLFLNRIKYLVHNKPIEISIRLFEKTGKKSFLEDAWFFDQKSKASILSYSISENEIKSKMQKTGLAKREKEARAVLTRLSLKAFQVTDTAELAEISDQIRDREIELGKIQEEMRKEESEKGTYASYPVPRISDVQKEQLDRNTALLSYHVSDDHVLLFYITGKAYGYKKIYPGNNFSTLIDSLVTVLHRVDGSRYAGDALSQNLYSLLIGPVEKIIRNLNRLIIIPDDELNYIPFEVLMNSKKEYLLRHFSVQYQYTASLFSQKKKKYTSAGVLAFAPFSASGNDSLTVLKHSAEEVSGLNGKIFLDKAATKNKFLEEAGRHPVIHLATHARVNDVKPEQSLIYFYPSSAGSEKHSLYQQEIYNLVLDSTRLVILSACETGAGRLIHGEGLMSLSRAFSYAGCPNIITSLWKAEDKSTAQIMKRFHFYFNKGNTVDKALQKAKIDFLDNDEVDPVYKTPNYWSHLLLIGKYETGTTSFWYVWPVLLLFLVIVAIYVLKSRAAPD